MTFNIDAVSVSRFGRVGVLFGGDSAEREISLQSGQQIFDSLKACGVDAVAIDTGSVDGKNGSGHCIEQIQTQNLDRAFIALHGRGGEDGSIQALLQYLDIPYTGSGVQASALAMHKVHSKFIFKALGIGTPDFIILNEHSEWGVALTKLGGKAIVKPVNEGSSIGMTIVDSAVDLARAYAKAKKHDAEVFAEQLIEGPEYTVSVIGGKALPTIKLETNNQFYDYEAKYQSDETRYLIPCGLSEAKHAEISTLAEQCFSALGCSGWGRVDFMADATGTFYALEVNTVPGMTSHSLVPMAAKASGLNFEQLCLSILTQTLTGAEQQ